MQIDKQVENIMDYIGMHYPWDREEAIENIRGFIKLNLELAYGLGNNAGYKEAMDMATLELARKGVTE